ncbi:MAG TPA: XTP/dITP diphosphatase [Dissulfurispiraceae bacterium]|nr:XTP/dITP diphosphatase [Dissulfurispiraceae bacterium]
MEIVLATRNKKKVIEIQRILDGLDIRFLTLDDFPECPEVLEDALTFEGNALKKAIAIANCADKIAVSDDSGLEVYALNGAPGVMSARYSGPGADDCANNEKLLDEMKSVVSKSRGARFICIIAIAFPDGKTEIFQGTVEGNIVKKPVGTMGFGYDPLFCPNGFSKTFAEMNPDEKDAISHRRSALEKLRAYLNDLSFNYF